MNKKKLSLLLIVVAIILLLPIAEPCGSYKSNVACAMPPQQPGQTVCYPAEYKPLVVFLAEKFFNQTIDVRYKKGIFCE